MAKKIQFKRGLYAGLPSLEEGEPGWATDTKELYVGDGSATPVKINWPTIAEFLSDYGLDSSLETFALPDDTTISAYGKTLVDDANASAALTTLGVSAFAKTLLDDAAAVNARATLGETDYWVSDYASLTAAVAAIGSTSATLVVNASTTITANTTVPATLDLEIKKTGLITQTAAYTLTINGPFRCGFHQAFSGFAAREVTFGAIEKAYPQWWGGLPDNSTDCTTAIMNAIYSHYHTHLTAGVWKTTDEILFISGIQGTGNYWGYKTLSGDGLRTIIRQVTATKNVLSLKYFYHTDGQDFWLEGVTVRDMSLIGEAGTYDALYLEGVHRSHFENLNCISGRYGIYFKGGLENVFQNVRSSTSLFDENPVSGVTPATPVNGFRTVKLEAFSGDMSVNVNDFNQLFCEGASSDGMVLSDCHGNRFFCTVESNGGTGLHMGTGNIQNEIKMWAEGHETDDLYIESDYHSRISILGADNKTVTLVACGNTRIHDSHVGTLLIGEGCEGVIVDNVEYATSYDDDGTATIAYNLRTGAFWDAGTLV